MRLLQRYILYELLRVFGLLLCAVTGLILIGGVIQEALHSGLRPLELLRILPFIVMTLLPYTLPSTLLLTVCVVFGRLSADQEITAGQAAGIPVRVFLLPALLLGTVLSAVTLVLKDQGIPYGIQAIHATIADAMEQILLNRLAAEGQLSEPALGYSVAVDSVSGRQLNQPEIRVRSGDGELIVVSAATATVRIDGDRRQALVLLNSGRVLFEGGRHFQFDQNELALPVQLAPLAWKARYASIQDIQCEMQRLADQCEQLRIRRAMSVAMALSTGDFDQMADSQLCRTDQYLDHIQGQRRRCNKEVHHRIALSAGCFLFVLVGCPWAIRREKRQILTTFLLCFLPVTLVYYPIVLLTMNLADQGVVSPWWSAWTGNSLLLLAGIRLLWHRSAR